MPPNIHTTNHPNEHTTDKNCWCKPYLYRTCSNGVEVWVHRDPEGSEPPPEVLAEAIINAAWGDCDEEDA